MVSASSYLSRVHGTQPANSSTRVIAHGSPSCSAAINARSSSVSAFSRSASTLIAMSPRNRNASAMVNGSSCASPKAAARSSTSVAASY